MAAENIVQSLLTPDARLAEFDAYDNWMSSEGLRESGHLDMVFRAVEEPVYGIAVASTLRFLRTEAEDVSPADARLAAQTLGRLTNISAAMYAHDFRGARPRGWYGSQDFRTETHTLHEAVSIGSVNPHIMSRPMTAEEGRLQVQMADRVFSDPELMRRGIQRILADANYGTTFTAQTMQGAADFPDSSPAGIARMQTDTKMPWLTKTNVASAFILDHVARGVSTGDYAGLDVIDAGSGTGATMAAIVSAFANSGGAIDLSKISLTGLESNRLFMPLLDEFAVQAADMLSVSADDLALSFENADISEAVGRQVANAEPGRIVAVDENYVFHRLPSAVKQIIVGRLAQADNGLFVFGDLARNGSRVNRGYFNFTNNGPLNTGNLSLIGMLHRAGFTVRQSHHAVPEVLERAIRHESDDNDCIAGFAFKGRDIGRLLTAA